MGKQDTAKDHAGKPAIETELKGETETNPIEAAMGMAAPQAARSGDTWLDGQSLGRSGDTR